MKMRIRLVPESLSARLDGDSQRRLALAATALILIVYAYGIGRTCTLGIEPVSAFRWLLNYWSWGGEYAHGYLVPVIAIGVFAWKVRTGHTASALQTGYAGVLVVLLAVFTYWAGVRAAVPRLVAGSLIVLLFGLMIYLAGWHHARQYWFPVAFLFFMIPLNFLEEYVAVPLRFFVASCATALLTTFGMDVQQNGTGIFSLSNRFSPLDVANPCSGIRSLVALMALTALYGYVVMDRWWKKWILFLSSVPLAVIGNLARITTVALVAQGFGSEWAMKIYHDYSGYIVFSLAILCMIALGVLLNLDYAGIWHRWFCEEIPAKGQSPRPPRLCR